MTKSAIALIYLLVVVIPFPLWAEEVNLYSYGYRTGIWQTNLIPVCWENAGYEQEKQWIRSAVARTWEDESALIFSGWNQCTATDRGIRILIAEEWPHTKGLGSTLNGRRNGMVLNVTFNSFSLSCKTKRRFCIETIAVHEFGHALSFAHEQNRQDTPAWCKQEPQGTSGDIILTPWDTDSVMNYCNLRWSNEGVLSRYDTRSLRQWYGRPSWKPTASEDTVLNAVVQNDLEKLKANLTPEIIDAQDANGHTPLMLAVDKCRIDAALFLIASGANLNVRNTYEDTALSIAKGTPGELRERGITQPRCADLVPVLSRYGARE